MEQDNTKKYLLYLITAVLFACAVVAVFGRVEFHNELERGVLPHTLIGYIDDNLYNDIAVITENNWPLWTEAFDRQWEDTLVIDTQQSGARIGIYANLVYYENRYEKRTWFSGKLVERASEYYYKPEGNLYLEAVYAPYPEQKINLEQIVPQSYDFYAFSGTE